MMWQNLFCVPPMVHPDCTNGQPIICIANPDMYRVAPVFFFNATTQILHIHLQPKVQITTCIPYIQSIHLLSLTRDPNTVKMGNKACQKFGLGTGRWEMKEMKEPDG